LNKGITKGVLEKTDTDLTSKVSVNEEKIVEIPLGVENEF
jgi:hypothetical protein